MGWSLKVARIAGIDVYMHVTFALLLVWVAMASYAPRHEVEDAFTGVAFILCLFAIVVLHELGHALTARQYGIKTRDILLLPIGGVARLERMPEDPKQELLVALAGPAVNVVLAGIFFAVILVTHVPVTPPEEMTPFGGNLLIQLFAANVFLAIFNLLPAFPMDGGRVLRALLAMRFEYVRATRIAAEIGKAMAVVFGFVGLMSNPFLLIIALFVWAGADAEAAAVQFRVGLAGVPVSRAMIREFATLTPNTLLADASRHALDGFQHDFPVVEERWSASFPATASSADWLRQDRRDESTRSCEPTSRQPTPGKWLNRPSSGSRRTAVRSSQSSATGNWSGCLRRRPLLNWS